jgi:SEC-C motif-containing protein
MMKICPCRLMDSTKLTWEECCGPYLSGAKKPATAEILMRSRYSAMATEQIDYIENTQKKSADDDFDLEATVQWAKNSNWHGLKVTHTELGKENDVTGIVEFSAFFEDKKTGNKLEHKERSTFEKINHQWLFVEGDMIKGKPFKREGEKVGRNDPCSCGSGKKYKKCCGKN